MPIGSIFINGSGRTSFWKVTRQSFEESPVFGKGAGSAEGLIKAYWPTIAHPHSDYVRIAHDYGIVGLTTWVAGVVLLLLTLWSNCRSQELDGNGRARIQMTAFLALAAYAMQMTADNALVYLFMAAPVGLIVGAGLGVGALKCSRS